MAKLTRELVIRNERASEIQFRAEANAADRQAASFGADQQVAEHHRAKAQEFRECADIARRQIDRLERAE